MRNERKLLDIPASEEAIFYLRSEDRDGWESGVWFVNNSDEILTYVVNASGGYASSDDDVVTMSASGEQGYRDVQPKEAVLIDTYDVMFDGDFMIQFAVDVTAPSFGKQTFATESRKGGNPDGVLLWKPLPEELPDPDDPEKVLAPEKAADIYMQLTGRYLDKKVSLNRGDMTMDYAAKRLAPSGVVLEKTTYRRGTITEYKFSDESGQVLYRTCTYLKACYFVERLKK